MCESRARGGRRCRDYRRLAALSSGQIAPDPVEDVPDVFWRDDSMEPVWQRNNHHAVGAAIERLLADRAVEPGITATLSAALPAGARLHGLEARMKSPSSTAEKVDRKRRGDESSAATVGRFTDTLRYTVCTREHDAIVPVARKVLGRLKDRGLRVVEATDTYREGAGYKGLHFLVRDDDTTTVFELQVHSELSQKVKDEIHPFYEVARSPDASDAEVERARAECVRLSSVVPVPSGLPKARSFAGFPLQHR